jgi:hypothetical protein
MPYPNLILSCVRNNLLSFKSGEPVRAIILSNRVTVKWCSVEGHLPEILWRLSLTSVSTGFPENSWLMVVPVVNVRVVDVGMGHRLMLVWVAVRFSRWVVGGVFVPVVFVMNVALVMLHRFVSVIVFVPLRQIPAFGTLVKATSRNHHFGIYSPEVKESECQAAKEPKYKVPSFLPLPRSGRQEHEHGKVQRQSQQKSAQASSIDPFPWLILIVGGSHGSPVPTFAPTSSSMQNARCSLRLDQPIVSTDVLPGMRAGR